MRRSAPSTWERAVCSSLIFGFIAFEIIGLNMAASVDWSPMKFAQQFFWLALEPPAPEYGLHIPPLAKGGWWLMAGFFLTMSIMLWWVRTYRRAITLGRWYAYGVGLCRRDLALSGDWLHSPGDDGFLVRGAAVRYLPASRLDCRLLDRLR